MSRYVDFVLCRVNGEDGKTLFHAPKFSYLEKGDMVIVDTIKGEKMAQVVASITVADDEMDKIDFIMEATNSSEDVRKVLSKVIYSDLDYKEDKDEG